VRIDKTKLLERIEELYEANASTVLYSLESEVKKGRFDQDERVKFFELRDSMTFIPVVCFQIDPSKLSEEEKYLAGRAGIRTRTFIYMLELTSDQMFWDFNRWGGARDTRHICHDYIYKHWEELSSGDVVDAEFLLGEKDQPAISERIGEPHQFSLEELTGVSPDGLTETNRNIDKYLEEKRIEE
jgi:hypothetical protein